MFSPTLTPASITCHDESTCSGRLKKTETNDKSAPVIEAGVKVGEAPQSALFAQIAAKGQTA